MPTNAQLESSWVLEDRLIKIHCSAELKKEILRYIEKEHTISTGKRMSLSNLYYRNNLHYIEDSIEKIGLVEELRLFNNQ